MARKIQILLPDGIAKRTMLAGVDAGMKWGHALYLEIFIRGLGDYEKFVKLQRTQEPPASLKPKTKKEKEKEK